MAEGQIFMIALPIGRPTEGGNWWQWVGLASGRQQGSALITGQANGPYPIYWE